MDTSWIHLSRVPARQAYRDSCSSHILGYPHIPRGSSRILSRTAYMDDGYGKRFERPLPSFHEGRAQDNDTISSSKRPYAALDGVPPRYVNVGVRYSNSRLAYEHNPPLYGDRYGDRDVGRSGSGYSDSRRSVSNQEPHWRYTSRPEYGKDAYGASESRKHSSYGGDYMSRGADRASGSGAFSSLYTSQRVGESSSYVGGGSSGSCY